jgi:hypothetical protein
MCFSEIQDLSPLSHNAFKSNKVAVHHHRCRRPDIESSHMAVGKYTSNAHHKLRMNSNRWGKNNGMYPIDICQNPHR